MIDAEAIPPGIYFNLPETVYHAIPALSCSGMKKLAVSPLSFWHHNLNPDRPAQKESSAQRFGKAVHCLGLEPDRFATDYAIEPSQEDYPGALVTTDDMKTWLVANGLPKTAKRKQELVDRIVTSGLPATIWDEVVEQHSILNAGKALLAKDEEAKVRKAAAVLATDPYAKAVLTGGVAEVSFVVREPETGVLLKARMDYVRPTATIDIKTFSNSRGKTVDKAVFDAIYYEGYHLQCAVYTAIRELGRQQLVAGEIVTHGNVCEAWLKGFTETPDHGFGFMFIESDEPFDLRIIQMKQAEAAGGATNVYWSAAVSQMRDMIELYAECIAKYGNDPWREPQPPRILLDTDIPQLMFAA